MPASTTGTGPHFLTKGVICTIGLLICEHAVTFLHIINQMRKQLLIEPNLWQFLYKWAC